MKYIITIKTPLSTYVQTPARLWAHRYCGVNEQMWRTFDTEEAAKKAAFCAQKNFRMRGFDYYVTVEPYTA